MVLSAACMLRKCGRAFLTTTTNSFSTDATLMLTIKFSYVFLNYLIIHDCRNLFVSVCTQIPEYIFMQKMQQCFSF